LITKQRHTELTGTYPFRHFKELMMNGVMDGSGSLTWGIGWGGLLASFRAWRDTSRRMYFGFSGCDSGASRCIVGSISSIDGDRIR
jgi:hypothetical protein